MDLIAEIIASIRERVRGSFTLSFLFAWLYFHWKIVVILLYERGDSDFIINQIGNHIIENHWCGMILKPMIWGVIGYAAFNALSTITILISTFFQKYATPYLLKFIPGAPVVLSDSFKNVEVLWKSYEKKFHEADALKISAEKRADDYERRVGELTAKKFNEGDKTTYDLSSIMKGKFKNIHTWDGETKENIEIMEIGEGNSYLSNETVIGRVDMVEYIPQVSLKFRKVVNSGKYVCINDLQITGEQKFEGIEHVIDYTNNPKGNYKKGVIRYEQLMS